MSAPDLLNFDFSNPEIYLPIQAKPRVGLVGEGLENLKTSELSHIVVGSGIIAVNAASSCLSMSEMQAAILATLGLSNQEIAGISEKSPHTIKNQIAVTCNKLLCRSRSGIARSFFESETYTVAERGGSLGLAPAEIPIVESLSYGFTRDNSKDMNGGTEGSIRSRLYRIGNKTGWHGQVRTILAAFIAGDIGNFAMSASEVQSSEPALPVMEVEYE